METEKDAQAAIQPGQSAAELDESQLDQVSGGSKWELAELDAAKTQFNPKEIKGDRIKFDTEID
jgi:hypothetical protein